MGSSRNFPTREDPSDTVTVADFFNGLSLPHMDPLSVATETMAKLPELPTPATACDDPTPNQLSAARTLVVDCADAIESLERHKNRCSAMMAIQVERITSATTLEGTILELDPWQLELAQSSMQSELAVILHINEGSAERLIDNCNTIVRELPTTLSTMESGTLSWEYAVIIAEETELLRRVGVDQDTIDGFEQLLLGKAQGATLSSFREKARRARERAHPETIAARTQRAYKDRHMLVSNSRDGMTWLSLYGPSPSMQAIWDQCTYTAQAAQGPHEERTLVQLRIDVATALLLQQTLDDCNIHSPAPGSGSGSGSGSVSGYSSTPTTSPAPPRRTAQKRIDFSNFVEPDPCLGGPFPDPQQGDSFTWLGRVPSFDDPNYRDPKYREPDPRSDPWWHPTAKPPKLIAYHQGESDTTAVSSSPQELLPESGPPPIAPQWDSSDSPSNNCEPESGWPPMPRVIPVVLIPVLSLLKATNEPAWMEGVGPISIDIAKRLTADSPTVYRLLTDPVTNVPLDVAPDRYRISSAMRRMLRIRDEYCQFPGCNAHAINCEVDHVKSFLSGGRSIYNNLEHLCRRHHMIKHFKDDRTRNGCARTDQTAERSAVKLRGWTPSITETGELAWTTPTGK